MRSILTALAILTFPVALVPAWAVDLPPAPVLDDEEDEDAVGEGWYLRGDIGGLVPYAARGGRDFGSAFAPPLVGTRLDRSLSAGVGVGYRFSPWFRADATAEHRFSAGFRGIRIGPGGAFGEDRTDVDATFLLANGYLDLPLWNGITPYLGLGIGVGQAGFDAVRRDAANGDGAVTAFLLPSRSRTGLAWALMGGIAVDVGPNLTLDLGYRYSRLDGIRLGEGGESGRFKALAAHEVRIGARYLFR